MVFSKKKSSRATNVGSLTYGAVSQSTEQDYNDSLYRILHHSGLDLSTSEQQGAVAGAGSAVTTSPKKTGSKHSSGVNTLPLLRSAKKEKKRQALRQHSELASKSPPPTSPKTHSIPQYDVTGATASSPPQSYLLAFRGSSFDPNQRPMSEYVTSNFTPSPNATNTTLPEDFRHSVHGDRLQGYSSTSSFNSKKPSNRGKFNSLSRFIVMRIRKQSVGLRFFLFEFSFLNPPRVLFATALSVQAG